MTTPDSAPGAQPSPGMQPAAPQPEGGATPVPTNLLANAAASLADGQWRRVHPATPLFRGGLALIVILGIVIANLRDRILSIFLPAEVVSGLSGGSYDPVDEIVRSGIIGWALLAVAVLLILIIGFSYLSWRMHTYRVTGEAVEVRSGIIFRTHRQAKLDRIQGLEIVKPFIPRLFGAARLEIGVAGANSSVKLEYLRSREVDSLRADILTLASGITLAERRGVDPATLGRADAAVASGAGGGLGQVLTERADEFFSAEVDHAPANLATAVRIPVGRLIASTIFSWVTVILVAVIVAVIILSMNGTWFSLSFVVVLPFLIGTGSYIWNSLMRGARYSVAATDSGVRVAAGLLTTTSETIRPGRVHAVEIAQPLLWRPFGWWQVRINKAGLTMEDMSKAGGGTTVLPVGTLADAERVLKLLFARPDSAEDLGLAGAMTNPVGNGFTVAPRRAVWLDPFAWKRTGYLLTEDSLLLRRGVLWRSFIAVPLARLQSLQITQGPLHRAFGLAAAQVHTVLGPVSPRVPVMSVSEASRFFALVSRDTVRALNADSSEDKVSLPSEAAASPQESPSPLTAAPGGAPTAEESPVSPATSAHPAAPLPAAPSAPADAAPTAAGTPVRPAPPATRAARHAASALDGTASADPEDGSRA